MEGQQLLQQNSTSPTVAVEAHRQVELKNHTNYQNSTHT